MSGGKMGQDPGALGAQQRSVKALKQEGLGKGRRREGQALPGGQAEAGGGSLQGPGAKPGRQSGAGRGPERARQGFPA